MGKKKKKIYQFTEEELVQFCDGFFEHSARRLAREAARIATDQVINHLIAALRTK